MNKSTPPGGWAYLRPFLPGLIEVVAVSVILVLVTLASRCIWKAVA
jgi:hypothetical protein